MRKRKSAQKRTPSRRRKQAAPREYRMPRTAAELGIDCAVCHSPATWFDYGRGERDHRAGFICDREEKRGKCERLLVREHKSAP